MKIVLAVRQAHIRLALELVLSEEPGVTVVGEASEAEGCWRWPARRGRTWCCWSGVDPSPDAGGAGSSPGARSPGALPGLRRRAGSESARLAGRRLRLYADRRSARTAAGRVAPGAGSRAALTSLFSSKSGRHCPNTTTTYEPLLSRNLERIVNDLHHHGEYSSHTTT